MSVKFTTKEVIESMKIGLIHTPDTMSDFFKDTITELKAYGVPEGTISIILGQCTNGTLEATIKHWS